VSYSNLGMGGRIVRPEEVRNRTVPEIAARAVILDMVRLTGQDPVKETELCSSAWATCAPTRALDQVSSQFGPTGAVMERSKARRQGQSAAVMKARPRPENTDWHRSPPKPPLVCARRLTDRIELIKQRARVIVIVGARGAALAIRHD
jgi:hypothetical protein